MQQITFGSLFSGFGGMDLGLERAGLKCKWQVEINSYAKRVLEKHWPNVRRWDDIRTFQPDTTWGNVDLICGGDPCQENSIARGAYKAKAESPAIHFIRIIDELRPRFVLRENPRSQRNARWTWYGFRNHLESLGYTVLPFRLRSCCFGAEHKRERVFLLSELTNTNSINAKTWIQKPIIQKSFVPRACWGADKPGLDRALNGIPHRMERLTGLGNAVVPQVAEWIGKKILECL